MVLSEVPNVLSNKYFHFFGIFRISGIFALAFISIHKYN